MSTKEYLKEQTMLAAGFDEAITKIFGENVYGSNNLRAVNLARTMFMTGAVVGQHALLMRAHAENNLGFVYESPRPAAELAKSAAAAMYATFAKAANETK